MAQAICEAQFWFDGDYPSEPVDGITAEEAERVLAIAQQKFQYAGIYSVAAMGELYGRVICRNPAEMALAIRCLLWENRENNAFSAERVTFTLNRC